VPTGAAPASLIPVVAVVFIYDWSDVLINEYLFIYFIYLAREERKRKEKDKTKRKTSVAVLESKVKRVRRKAFDNSD